MKFLVALSIRQRIQCNGTVLKRQFKIKQKYQSLVIYAIYNTTCTFTPVCKYIYLPYIFSGTEKLFDLFGIR